MITGILNWTISSSVLIGIVTALRYLLRGKISLRLQYGLWLLVLVRLLTPVNFFQSPMSAPAAAGAVEIIGDAQALSEVITVQRYEDGSVSGHPRYDLMPDFPTQVAQSVTPERFSRMEATLLILNLLSTLYLPGAILLFVVFTTANSRFWDALFRDRRVLEVPDCPLPVYVTAAVDTPCLFGLFKPAIYLTPEGADPAVLPHVLAHELTHYRHKDHLWSALRCLCLALHWHNPLAWWAAWLSRQDSELACDEGAIRSIGEEGRAAYGRTLIALTCQKPGAVLLTATTMTGNKACLKERVSLIAKRPQTTLLTALTVVLVSAAAVGCTFSAEVGTVDSAEDILLSENISIPLSEELISAAKARAALDVDHHNDLGQEHGYTIVKAEITGLTPMGTGAATEHVGVDLYLLEYRLTPDHPEKVPLAHSMTSDGTQITEMSNAGPPYLIMAFDGRGPQSVVTCLGHTTLETIQYTYDSDPSLRAEFDNMFLAYAMLHFKDFFGG